MRLFARPEPLWSVLALLPDQPPRRFEWRGRAYRVVGGDGPERIHGEWWRRDAEVWAVRDYFRIEDADGGRFWVFRRGDGVDSATRDLSWWIHGIFACASGTNICWRDKTGSPDPALGRPTVSVILIMRRCYKPVITRRLAFLGMHVLRKSRPADGSLLWQTSATRDDLRRSVATPANFCSRAFIEAQIGEQGQH
jgi:hypothetical protein